MNNETKQINRTFFLLIVISLIIGTIVNYSKDYKFDAIVFGKRSLVYLKMWQISEYDRSTEPWKILNWKNLDSISNKINYPGIFYLKTSIIIDKDPDHERFYGICGIVGSAYEIYWDSSLIAQNGTPSKNSYSEQPGLFFNPVIIDRILITPGLHSIFIKVSNHQLDDKKIEPDFFIGDHNFLLSSIYERQANVLFLIGICFITVILNLFMFYYSEKRLHYLFFLALCILIIIGLGIRFRWVFNEVLLTYSNFADNALPINILLISFVFPLFFIFYFYLPKKNIIIAGSLLTSIILFFIYYRQIKEYALASLLISSLISLITIIWAIKLKRSGSLTSLIGIITIILLSILFNKSGSDQKIMGGEGLIYAIIFFIAFFNFSIAREFSRKEKLLKEIELKSISLENELLRKQIQPHFLMNSLNSIIIWLKRDPPSAIKLIEALADEFRIISEVSGNKLIPIEQEIFLCESHLKIMSLRRDADFKLEIRGATKDILIPPMVLLTLVENGLTHGYENRNEGKFILTISKLSGKIIITLFNDSSETGEPVSSEGTGMKYIKARLDQNFANSWSFDYKRVTDGWEVTIELN